VNRKPHIPTIAALLVAGVAIWWTIDPASQEAGREVETAERGSGETAAGDGETPLVTGTKAGDRPVAKRHPAEVMQAAVEGRPLSSKSVDAGFIERLGDAGDGGQVSFELPDGRQAIGRVVRRRFDERGRLVDVEGVLEKPVAGRFLFQEEPEGNAWPMSGVVRLFDEEISYRVEPAGDGTAALVERPIDSVVCRDFSPPVDEAEGGETEEVPADHPTNIPIPDYQNGVVPLQSIPGATAVLYLDFDGGEGPFEGWGDFDAAPATNLSVSNIFQVWRRVSEDFAPFQFNVTTDLQVFLAAPQNSRQRCMVTPTTDAAPGAGGVAYVGSFDWSSDRVCWAFYSSGKNSAEVISHELGHTLDLSHDGRTDPSETYYGGHGSGDVGWAPIMGVGYGPNLTQWSKGEYLNANRTQDDVSILANNNNNVGGRPDDHGDSAGAASSLDVFSDESVDDEGLVETRDDVDVFSFTTAGGAVNLAIDPENYGPNVDLLAELYDSASGLVTSSNPDTLLEATISATLAAGDYTLHISGVGRGDPLGVGYTDYASLGSYTITGTVVGGEGPERFSIAENPSGGAAVGTVTPRNNHGANPLTFVIDSGNGSGAFSIVASTGALTVAFEGLSSSWDVPSEFELVVTVSDSAQPSLDETLRVVVTVTDVNELPVLIGESATVPEALLADSEVVSLSLTDPDRFEAHTWSIVSGNTGGTFQVDNNGVITVAVAPDYVATSSYTLGIDATDTGNPGLIGSATVTVDVIDIPAGYQPGIASRTVYDGISGGSLSNLTGSAAFPEDPDREVELDEFDDGSRGDNYGSTVRAFLIAPFTADYTFWIAGDDDCELRLSPNTNPASATVRAGFGGWTDPQEWDKFGGQQSSAIALVAGQIYYIEARHKEGSGGDHLAVAWQAVDGGSTLISQEVIPATFLAPHSMNYRPRVADLAGTVYEQAFPGTTVATIAATELNSGQSHGYAITGGDPGGVFGIDAASGRVFVAQAGVLDAQATPSHVLTITATDDGSPILAGSGTLSVSVSPSDEIAASGMVQAIWDGISGTGLSALYGDGGWPDHPDRVRVLNDFNSGEKIADNYGARIRGYLVPPTTGAYTLWLASDDNGSLLLSTDEDPANAVEVASISNWTGYLEWDKYTSQESAPVSLVAGQRYFIEARVKEGGGGDHLSVGWTGPGIASVTVPEAPDVEPFDSNTAPVFGSGSYSFSMNPDDPVGTLVGDVAATSQAFEGIAYAILSGDAAGVLAIDPTTGRITVADSSASYPGQTLNLTVGAQDDGYGGLFPPADGTVAVTVQVSGITPLEQWRQDEFGAQAGDPLVAGDDADPEFDGIVNLLEYALNLDPLGHPATSPPYAGLPEAERSGGSIAIVYRRNLAAVDLNFVVEECSDLTPPAAWQASAVSEQVVSDDGSTRVIRASVAEPPGGRLFLRLRVSSASN